MAQGIWATQAGGADSSELTAAAADVIKGKTAITSDSNGDPITGTLELTGNATAAQVMSGYTFYATDPKTKLTGTMTIASVVNFSVAQYSSLNIICSWALPSRGPWSGIRIVAKQGSYPTGVNDGTLVYHGSGTSAIKALAAGTWYIRAWNYATINGAAVYGGYVQATVNNQQIRGTQTYTASGVFAVPAAVRSVQVFCVGGGASGAVNESNPTGGGGGGYTTTKTVSVTPGQQIPVTIGAGGAWITTKPSGTAGRRNAGGATSFGSLVSANGGANSTNSGGMRVGGYGGSGGGGAGVSTVKAGNGGSDGSNGGEGSVGAGVGQGTTTRAFGESDGTLYAGGGGGAVYTTNVDRQGLGGSGGGGNGALNGRAATAGAANTGGGGGGAIWYGEDSGTNLPSIRQGAAGGSGICIIRWGY